MASDREVDEDDRMVDSRVREAKAIRTMEMELQIPRGVVVPILRKLLETFEGEWSHIEADGYRLLADTIFQQQESVDKEMAPGSSRARKKGQKKARVTRSNPPRKAARRASKQVESEESSDTTESQEADERDDYAPADWSTQVKESRPAMVKDVQCEGSSKSITVPLLAEEARSPRIATRAATQDAQKGGGRRELIRKSTGQAVRQPLVSASSKETQTESICRDHTAEASRPRNKLIIPVKRESGEGARPCVPNTEVRGQLLSRQDASRATPIQSVKAPIATFCSKCECVRAVFDVSKVKVEVPESVQSGATTSSGWGLDPKQAVIWNGNQEAPRFLKANIVSPANHKEPIPITETPAMGSSALQMAFARNECFNPKPLQIVAPTSSSFALPSTEAAAGGSRAVGVQCRPNSSTKKVGHEKLDCGSCSQPQGDPVNGALLNEKRKVSEVPLLTSPLKKPKVEPHTCEVLKPCQASMRQRRVDSGKSPTPECALRPPQGNRVLPKPQVAVNASQVSSPSPASPVPSLRQEPACLQAKPLSSNTESPSQSTLQIKPVCNQAIDSQTLPACVTITSNHPAGSSQEEMVNTGILSGTPIEAKNNSLDNSDAIPKASMEMDQDQLSNAALGVCDNPADAAMPAASVDKVCGSGALMAIAMSYMDFSDSESECISRGGGSIPTLQTVPSCAEPKMEKEVNDMDIAEGETRSSSSSHTGQDLVQGNHEAHRPPPTDSSTPIVADGNSGLNGETVPENRTAEDKNLGVVPCISPESTENGTLVGAWVLDENGVEAIPGTEPTAGDVKDSTGKEAASGRMESIPESAKGATPEMVQDFGGTEPIPEDVKDSTRAEAVLEDVKDSGEMESVPENAKESTGAEASPENVKDSGVGCSRADVKPPKAKQGNGAPRKTSSSSTSSGSCGERKRRLVKKSQWEVKPVPPAQEKQVHHKTPSVRRHDPNDVSRGRERVPISLWSPSDNEDLPSDFFYIRRSVAYQSAHTGFSLARIGEDDCCTNCTGNCLDSALPCACARLTDGEYAYTVEGCLYQSFLQQEMDRKQTTSSLSYCQPGACPVERMRNEKNPDVCKGHIQRRFIKECWEKCGCTQQCGNRVVQRGINRRLQVFWTEEGKGWGLRTLEHLPAGTFVCEYVGEILTNLEMDQRNTHVQATSRHHFPLQLDADWCSERLLKDEEALCLDGTYYGNVARFINHRCFDTNLLEVPVEIESPDHHYYHLAFFTSKDVKAEEELTWDYGLDFNDKEHPIEAFKCLCGSAFCRGKAVE